MTNYSAEVINYYSEQSEQQSLHHLKNDLQVNFSNVYDKYSPSIFGIIMQWEKNEKLAEELLGTVFKNAWKSRQSYDGSKQRIFTWLYLITLTAYNKQKTIIG